MTRTILIGAGIAGLATAWRLSARGVGPITVLEREPLAFSHSSARNAAIFRPLEESHSHVRLVERSSELFEALGPDQPIVRRTGLCLTANAGDDLTALRATGDALGVPYEHLPTDALVRRCPAVHGGRSREGLWLPDGGVIDIHQMSELLRRKLQQAGVEIKLSHEVRALTRDQDTVTGVELVSGAHLAAERVVLAAGAWAAHLGRSVGAPLPLTPHRRHLSLLLPTTEHRLDAAHPVVWNVSTGIYFRPESGGVLACPGDHEPAEAGVPLVNDAILATLAQELPLEAPIFSLYAAARPWACLRTMSDTHETVLGPDPRVGGLFWLAGLGGHGMSAGLGAADYLADAMLDKPLPEWSTSIQVSAHLRANNDLTHPTQSRASHS
jgi:D-arginine dehydrogenase